jgi:hypothetical protein
MPTVFLVIAVWGFWPFYSEGLGYRRHPLMPDIRWQLLIHGGLMSLWLILFWSQSLCVAFSCRQLHRRLGYLGLLIAVIMAGQASILGIESVRLLPHDALINMLKPNQFLIIPLFNVTVFSLCVFGAVVNRNTPQIHRALMGFATLSILSAAIGRIDTITSFYARSWMENLSGPYLPVMILGLIISLVERWQKGCWNRSFLWTLGLFSVSVPFVIMTSKTPLWDSLSTFLLDVSDV